MVRRIDVTSEYDPINKTVTLSAVVTNNGVEVSHRHFYFTQSQFSCVLDEYTPNIAVFHCGNNSLMLSNGDYDEFYQNGTDRTDAYTLANALASAIIVIE